MKNEDICKLHDSDAKEYNDVLEKIKIYKFSLYQPTMNQPTRFCIVSEAKFNDMVTDRRISSRNPLAKIDCEEKKYYCELKLINGDEGNTRFLYGITNLPNVMLPGVCVSMWRHSINIQDVSIHFTETIEKSFGRGFGDRSCAPCLGVNAYFGHHYSKRVIDRPETIPGTRVLITTGGKRTKIMK